MNPLMADWLKLVRDYHALMASAKKLDTRDPEGAAILRSWAQDRAHALSEAPQGSESDAQRVLGFGKKIFRKHKKNDGAT